MLSENGLLFSLVLLLMGVVSAEQTVESVISPLSSDANELDTTPPFSEMSSVILHFTNISGTESTIELANSSLETTWSRATTEVDSYNKTNSDDHRTTVPSTSSVTFKTNVTFQTTQTVDSTCTQSWNNTEVSSSDASKETSPILRYPIPYYLAGITLACLVLLGICIIVNFIVKRKRRRETILSYLNPNYLHNTYGDQDCIITDLEQSDSYTFENPQHDPRFNVSLQIQSEKEIEYVC